MNSEKQTRLMVSYMINMDSLNYQKITELQNSVSQLQQQIDSTNQLKIWTLAASIGVPIFVGIVLFILNRNKDYKIKQGEVAGDVYENGFMFKAKNLICIQQYFQICHHENVISLMRENSVPKFSNGDVDFWVKEILRIKEEFDKNLSESDAYLQALVKSVGTYRFYLNKKGKIRIDEATRNITSCTSVVEGKQIERVYSLDKINKHYEKYIKESQEEYNSKNEHFFNELDYMLDGFFIPQKKT